VVRRVSRRISQSPPRILDSRIRAGPGNLVRIISNFFLQPVR
jgi:hypothetical protein